VIDVDSELPAERRAIAELTANDLLADDRVWRRAHGWVETNAGTTPNAMPVDERGHQREGKDREDPSISGPAVVSGSDRSRARAGTMTKLRDDQARNAPPAASTRFSVSI